LSSEGTWKRTEPLFLAAITILWRWPLISGTTRLPKSSYILQYAHKPGRLCLPYNTRGEEGWLPPDGLFLLSKFLPLLLGGAQGMGRSVFLFHNQISHW
jgi:hypothetical protein